MRKDKRDVRHKIKVWNSGAGMNRTERIMVGREQEQRESGALAYIQQVPQGRNESPP